MAGVFFCIIACLCYIQVDPKFLRNLKFVRKGNMKAVKEAKNKMDTN